MTGVMIQRERLLSAPNSVYKPKPPHPPQHMLGPAGKLPQDTSNRYRVITDVWTEQEFIHSDVLTLTNSIRILKYLFNQ